jgi:hypothetical protein
MADISIVTIISLLVYSIPVYGSGSGSSTLTISGSGCRRANNIRIQLDTDPDPDAEFFGKFYISLENEESPSKDENMSLRL